MKIASRPALLLINFVVVATYGSPDHLRAESPEGASQPNIIVIMADDLGWMDLHCYGNERLETPSIDKLATEGMRFTDA